MISDKKEVSCKVSDEDKTQEEEKKEEEEEKSD